MRLLMLFSLVVSLGLSNAIIFDASCAAYDALLKDGFTTAFTNANYAQEALLRNPLEPGVNDVAGWLFGSSSNYAVAQTRLENVGNIPSSFSYDKTDKSNLADIVIYCNFDRFQSTPRGFYDLDTGAYSRISNDNFQGCKTGKAPSGNDPPAAMTINYERPGTLTTMDLCNWYLELILTERFQTIGDVATPGVLQRIDSDPDNSDPDYYDSDSEDGATSMDAATLFDTTALHEMTHSKFVGILQQDTGVGEQYDWIPCTSLKSPLNSESLALFALAVYLMMNGYNILEDGQLLAVAQQLSRRSSLLRDEKEVSLRFGYDGEGRNGTVWVA